jgi:hypothetical protein
MGINSHADNQSNLLKQVRKPFLTRFSRFGICPAWKLIPRRNWKTERQGKRVLSLFPIHRYFSHGFIVLPKNHSCLDLISIQNTGNPKPRILPHSPIWNLIHSKPGRSHLLAFSRLSQPMLDHINAYFLIPFRSRWEQKRHITHISQIFRQYFYPNFFLDLPDRRCFNCFTCFYFPANSSILACPKTSFLKTH